MHRQIGHLFSKPKIQISHTRSFLKQFLKIYNDSFPLIKITIKQKQLISPWITKGLIKSSKQKQKLYIKFLKRPTYKNETTYKTYKRFI